MIRSRNRARGFVAANAAPLALRTVVTQNRMAGGSETRGGADSQITRYFYVIGQDCSSICLSFMGWSWNSGGLAAIGNNYNIIKAAAVYNSTNSPVYFSGSRSGVVLNNATDFQSDEVLASAFGVSKFTKGDVLEIRTHSKVDTAGVGKIPFTDAFVADYTGQQATWFLSTDYTVDNIDGTGSITFTGAGSLQNRSTGLRPIVLGRPLVDKPSFVVVGADAENGLDDSISYLMADSSDPIRLHGRGYIQRAMRNSANDTESLLSCINFSRNSANSGHLTSDTRLYQYYKYARFGIEALGSNDLVAATLQTNLAGIWSTMRTEGIEKIIRPEYLCKTTSTDLWATESNQTYDASGNWQSGGDIDTIHSFFATKLTDNTIDYIMSGDAVKGTDLYKWRTDGSANTYTDDGFNPSAFSHTLLAATLSNIVTTIDFLSLKAIATSNTSLKGTETRGTHTGFLFHFAVRIGSYSNTMVLNAKNWSTGNSGEVDNINALNIQSVSVYKDGGSTTVPVYKDGSRSFTLAAGANDINLDVLHAYQFGEAKFSKNDIYWIKGYGTINSGDFVPYSSTSVDQISGNQFWFFTGTPSSTDVTGGYTVTGTTDIRGSGYRFNVLGNPINTAQKSFIFFNDSIIEGTGDTPSDAGVDGNGYFQRAMHNDAGVAQRSSLMIARHGNDYPDVLGSNTRWREYIKYADYAVDQGGANDIGGSGTATPLATIQTNVQSLWTILANAGLPIIRIDLLPRTTSTDLWVTEANQTVNAGWGSGEIADQFRDFLQTKLTDNTLIMIIPSDSVRGVDPYKAKVDGVTPRYTMFDGTHQSAGGCELMAEVIRDYLETL